MTEQNENIDSTNDDVEVETTEEVTTTEDSKEELTDREKQFLARAKKAEAKFKAVKDTVVEPKPEPINKPNTEQTGLTREETIFFAQGGTEEQLELAKKIASVDGVSILVAREDELFKSKVAAQEHEAKVKANTMGASNGSQTGKGHAPKPIGEMTREEHMEYVKSKIKG